MLLLVLKKSNLHIFPIPFVQTLPCLASKHNYSPTEKLINLQRNRRSAKLFAYIDDIAAAANTEYGSGGGLVVSMLP